MTPADAAAEKAAAAAAAVELVRDGMLLGLGTGSTAEIFVRLLGERVRAGALRVTGLPSSRAAEALAAQYGIPLVESVDRLDLAVDGADEVDGELRLIKGRGGALVREKLVALAAERFVVIADSTKVVERLGVGVTLPVEVVPFLWRETAKRLEGLGCTWALRGGEGEPFVSDNHNLIVDLSFASGIDDPDALGPAIKALPGVVDHGLFIGLASLCLVGTADGVRRLEASK